MAGRRWRVRSFVACFILLGAATVLLCAQEGGTSAGGKWMKFESEDKMTAAKKVRFELEADSSLQDSDAKPKVILYCKDGKLSLSDFHPNLEMGPPDHPSFLGRPQMQVRVRVDNTHDVHSWNWVNGNFLAMDKGTTRALIGANIFKVEFKTGQGKQIAEFSPAGLNLDQVSQACGLTPKKP